jgi:type II secretory pathway pseudopilin PulG
MRNSKNTKGYTTLLAVLVVAVVAGLISVSTMILGVDATRTALVYRESAQAEALMDACMEDALQEVRDSSSYVGSGGFSLGSGSCTHEVTSGGGDSRTIHAAGQVGNTIRRSTIEISGLSPLILVDAFDDVADF